MVAWIWDEMSFHKEGGTSEQQQKNKVRVSYKLINSVMKSHRAALSDDQGHCCHLIMSAE